MAKQAVWDIFLTEWLAASDKIPADIVNDLGWNKSKVSLMAAGKQRYHRDDINELAAYFNVRPFELLMHPDDAHGIRRLKAEMIRLAHQSEEVAPEEPPKKVSLN